MAGARLWPQETDILCPRLSGQRPVQKAKKRLGSADGAEKLSPLIPSFPSKLIKEEMALEVAAMTKRLLDAALMFQRALYRPHILHESFPAFRHQPQRPGKRAAVALGRNA